MVIVVNYLINFTILLIICIDVVSLLHIIVFYEYNYVLFNLKPIHIVNNVSACYFSIIILCNYLLLNL